MSKRQGAIRVITALFSLVLATVAAVAVQPGTAHARCNGEGVPITMAVPVGSSNPRATERANSGTCNDNNTYAGTLTDTYSDGYCAYLDVYDYSGGPYYITIVDCGGGTGFQITESDGVLYFVLSAAGYSAGRSNTGF
ncbi:hypothetical protein WEI85_12505 [Actinomycetes bacterium KLBMP 9797]